jgi:hypothetical protein
MRMRVCLLLLLAACDNNPDDDIGRALGRISGIKVTSVQPAGYTGYQEIDFTFSQPLDHNGTTSRRFDQRGFMLHRTVSAPVIFETEGYELPDSPQFDELTPLVAGNQIHLEHRFFHDNPHPQTNDDWQFLTIAQAAADHHAFVQALKSLYKGKWINTGASKGGETAIFHRRFYPGDVDATVAYVAPFTLGLDDTRFPPFVASRGTPTCRAAVTAAMRRVLQNRTTFDGILSSVAASQGLLFTLYTPDQALEYAVQGIPFTLWQYFDETACDNAPVAATDDTDTFSWIANVGVLLFYDDADVRYFGPYDYQVDTQLGGPGEDDSAIADLLVHQSDPDPSLPLDLATPFDARAMPDVLAWIASAGNHLLFIYGENDPWTAGQAALGSGDNALYIAPGGNHDSTIGALSDADRAAAAAKLSDWLGMTVPTPVAAAPARDHDASFRPRPLRHH